MKNLLGLISILIVLIALLFVYRIKRDFSEIRNFQKNIEKIIYKNLDETKAIQVFREEGLKDRKYLMSIWSIKAGKEIQERIKKEIKRVIKQPFILKEDKEGINILKRGKIIVKIRFRYPYRVAIVLDDCGSSKTNVLRFVKLNIPLTFSIIAGERYSKYLSKMLKEKGYEVLLHQGMEPKKYPENNPGKRAIFLNMSDEEIKRVVNENIDEIKPDGVNNHMGSRFMENEDKVRIFLRVLRRRGLFFFDSLTTPKTKGYFLAKKIGIPAQINQFFLDNKNDLDYVLGQLRKVKKMAMKSGWSVAIGHVHNYSTYLALKKIKEQFLRDGIEFVFLKELIDLNPPEIKREKYVSYRY